VAAAPRFKVYTSDGEYVAACRYIEDAAAVVGLRGAGTIRDGHHTVVWREGNEETSAADSYDTVTAVVWGRLRS